MDKGTFGGLLLAMVGIVGGLVLEGGNVGQVIQPTAALIVFVGTLGAVMVQFPLEVTLTAFRRLGNVFFQPDSIFPAIRAVTFSCLLRRAVWERRGRLPWLLATRHRLPQVPTALREATGIF